MPPLIEKDRNNVAWLVGTNTKVREVILDRLEYNWSVEEIHEQHPHLTLATIRAAFAYYQENQAELDAEIQSSLAEAEALCAKLSDPQFRQRLVQLRRNT